MTKCGMTCDYEPTLGGYTSHPWCDTCSDLALRRRNKQLAELAKRERRSSKRFIVLMSERGDLTCLSAGDSRISDYYRSWQVVIGVNRPLTTQRADAAKSWVVRNYYC